MNTLGVGKQGVSRVFPNMNYITLIKLSQWSSMQYMCVCVYISLEYLQLLVDQRSTVQWENGQRVSSGNSQKRLEWLINMKWKDDSVSHRNMQVKTMEYHSKSLSIWQKLKWW